MQLTPEDRFRNSADDLPPMVPAQFIVGPRIDGEVYAGYGWIAVILAFGILCIACAVIARASEDDHDRVIALKAATHKVSPESIDAAFNRMVDSEAEAIR